MMTEKHFLGFVDAMQRSDLEGMMEYIAEDCVYSITNGTTYEGKAAVRQIFTEMLADADGSYETSFGPTFVGGNRGSVEWAVRKDGKLVMRGCDLFEFAGDKIIRKDAFRKVS